MAIIIKINFKHTKQVSNNRQCNKKRDWESFLKNSDSAMFVSYKLCYLLRKQRIKILFTSIVTINGITVICWYLAHMFHFFDPI